MAKRATGVGNMKKTRSRKTAKRLAAKHDLLVQQGKRKA